MCADRFLQLRCRQRPLNKKRALDILNVTDPNILCFALSVAPLIKVRYDSMQVSWLMDLRLSSSFSVVWPMDGGLPIVISIRQPPNFSSPNTVAGQLRGLTCFLFDRAWWTRNRLLSCLYYNTFMGIVNGFVFCLEYCLWLGCLGR